MAEYRLIRMKRKSVSLSVDNDGTPLIKAPYGMSLAAIDGFYNEKKDWVVERQKELVKKNENRKNVMSAYVRSLTLFGKEYPVTHEKRQYGFDWTAFNLPDESFEELRPYIITIYRRIALADIPQRVRKYSEIIGVRPTAVKINSASTRWGSCSGKKSLNFSWKLILAPEDVIDYVVVHELCHIIHMDHSPAFWEEVGKVIPDWKEKRAELRNVQKIIGEKALE